mmetsp:Transcript_17271/g.30436  ORF Transcript_17271/g.30436 Transcript_17271/m.30436 type:complete len:362 (-) Transcript_17271:176-1261(-)|eukprot:CAMPEP_0184518336 /NCGR_PEP_ID=MMETSP0198_2-20121128/6032_1 /TAXON_ID=1112570 /ORGANISM="Thraustochytrium sp., Strain LLF1b" /LENGTH=361 /DNA_ID=CAMNT_0026908765 /DNA_START=150 /DNA_END=1235 /DNA_ORIENTATION=+
MEGYLKIPQLELPDYRAISEGFLVSVGVVMGIVSSLVVCVGINLQKMSLCAPENRDVLPWKQPKWVVGLICVVVGSLVDFMAFGLAPQSLLAPLGALSLVWNLFMASYLLDEKYTRVDVLAVGLIVCGTAITVVFASHTEIDYSLEQLKALYHETRMTVYGVAVPIFLAAHYCLLQAAQRNVFATGSSQKLAEMVGYAGFAGIAGGQSVLFAKSVVELLKDAIRGGDIYHIESVLILGAMTVSLLTQITFLNYGLKNFDSLYVVPVYQSYWIISGVIGGLVYFGEWEAFSTAQMVMFVLGTLVTLGGLLVLTKRESHDWDPSKSLSGAYARVTTAEEELTEDPGFSSEDDAYELPVSGSGA